VLIAINSCVNATQMAILVLAKPQQPFQLAECADFTTVNDARSIRQDVTGIGKRSLVRRSIQRTAFH
jgi:hypothetical protein